MKKHYRITNPIRFFIFVTIVTVSLVFATYTFLGFGYTEAAVTETYKVVQVKVNDTLWTIADEYCDPSADTRDTVKQICEINDISADEIQPGDTVIVPVIA